MNKKEYFLLGAFIFVFSMSFYVYSHEKTGLYLSPPEDFVGPPLEKIPYTECLEAQPKTNPPTPDCAATAEAQATACNSCCQQFPANALQDVNSVDCKSACGAQRQAILDGCGIITPTFEDNFNNAVGEFVKGIRGIFS